MKKFLAVLVTILIFLLISAVIIALFSIGKSFMAKREIERNNQIRIVTTELKAVMQEFKAEGYFTCSDFFDNGSQLPSVKANYYKNGVMRQYSGKFYWLRCNFTANRPVVVRLKNKRWPDQYIPPLADWGYIYDDSVAQELP